MTAKRFKFNGRNNCIEYDNKSILLDSYGEDIEELLNELHEENEQLKDVNAQCCNDYSAMRRDVLRYKEENEQLKQQFKEQRHEDINELSVIAMKYKAIEKENEELKQQLRHCEKFRHTVFQEISKEMSKHD